MPEPTPASHPEEFDAYRLQANTALQFAEQVWWSWNLVRHRLKIRAVGDCILGYGEEDLDRRESFWYERIHPEDWPSFKRSLDDCLKGRTQHWRCEHRLLDVAGDWVWVEESGFIHQRNQDNQPTEMVGVTRKVHESYQLLDLFFGAESVVDALAKKGPLPFILRDLEGEPLLHSHAFQNQFPTAAPPLENHLAASPEEQQAWQADFQLCLQTGSVQRTRQLRTQQNNTTPVQHSLLRVGHANHPIAVLECFQSL